MQNWLQSDLSGMEPFEMEKSLLMVELILEVSFLLIEFCSTKIIWGWKSENADANGDAVCQREVVKKKTDILRSGWP